jgi:hypothetical protein
VLDNTPENDRLRLRALEVGYAELKRAVEDNTSAVKALTDNTKAMVEIWRASSTLLSIATSVSKFLVAITLIWATIKGLFWMLLSKGGGTGG